MKTPIKWQKLIEHLRIIDGSLKGIDYMDLIKWLRNFLSNNRGANIQNIQNEFESLRTGFNFQEFISADMVKNILLQYGIR